MFNEFIRSAHYYTLFIFAVALFPIASEAAVGTLKVGVASDTPASRYVAVSTEPETTSAEFAKFIFTAQNEDIELEMLKVTLAQSADGLNSVPNFWSIELYNELTAVSSVQYPSGTNVTSPVALQFVFGAQSGFSFNPTPLRIPNGESVIVTLRAKMNGTASGARSMSMANFYIADVIGLGDLVESNVLAKGSASHAYVNVSAGTTDPSLLIDGKPKFTNAMTIVRSKPVFALCATSNCSKASPIGVFIPGTVEVIRFRISAEFGDVIFDGVNHNIRFSITQNGGSTAGKSATLYDATYSFAPLTISSINLTTTGTMNFTSINGKISRGTYREYYLMVDLSDYTTAGSSFQVSIGNAAEDFSWSDGITEDIAQGNTTDGLPIIGATLSGSNPTPTPSGPDIGVAGVTFSSKAPGNTSFVVAVKNFGTTKIYGYTLGVNTTSNYTYNVDYGDGNFTGDVGVGAWGSISPGESVNINFGPNLYFKAGTYQLKVTLGMAGDINLSNNTYTERLIIGMPTSTETSALDSSIIKNYNSLSASFGRNTVSYTFNSLPVEINAGNMLYLTFNDGQIISKGSCVLEKHPAEGYIFCSVKWPGASQGFLTSYLSITTTPHAGDLASPSPPTNVAVRANESDKSLIVSWNNPADFDFSEIRIYRSKGMNQIGELAEVKKNLSKSSSLVWVDSQAPIGAPVYYIVRSVDSSNNESTNMDAYSASLASISGTIDLISPNGGEKWEVGSTKKIQWTSNGILGLRKVSLELYKETRIFPVLDIATSQISDGEYSWAVPKSIVGIAATQYVSGDYKVGIRFVQASGDITDRSENYFAITNSQYMPLSISTIAPNGGENIPINSKYTIKWNPPVGVASVDIILIRDADSPDNYPIVALKTANTGKYEWDVSLTQYKYGGFKLNENEYYKVKIASSEDVKVFDISDNYFFVDKSSIVPPPISVAKPAKGEQWQRGKQYIIGWNSASGLLSKTNITVNYIDSRGKSFHIDTLPFNRNSYNWTIPLDISLGEYQIEIIDSALGKSARSEAFKIIEAYSIVGDTGLLSEIVVDNDIWRRDVDVATGDKEVVIFSFWLINQNDKPVDMKVMKFKLAGIAPGDNHIGSFSLYFYIDNKLVNFLKMGQSKPDLIFDRNTGEAFVEFRSLEWNNSSILLPAQGNKHFLLVADISPEAKAGFFEVSVASVLDYQFSHMKLVKTEAGGSFQRVNVSKQVTQQEAEKITTPPSEQCLIDGTLIKTPDDPKVYVIKNCKKEWIKTGEEFQKKGYKWEEVNNVVDPVLDAYADYLTAQANLIKALNDSRVYRVIEGKKLWVPSQDAFQSQKLNWNDVEETQAKEVESYPTANLIRAKNDAKVYFISESGFKKWIPSAEIFNSYTQNKWENIVEVEESVVDSFGEINLIRLHGGTKVYKLERGTKRWVKTEEVFEKLALDWSRIVSVNQTEFAIYIEGKVIE